MKRRIVKILLGLLLLLGLIALGGFYTAQALSERYGIRLELRSLSLAQIELVYYQNPLSPQPLARLSLALGPLLAREVELRELEVDCAGWPQSESHELTLPLLPPPHLPITRLVIPKLGLTCGGATFVAQNAVFTKSGEDWQGAGEGSFFTAQFTAKIAWQQSGAYQVGIDFTSPQGNGHLDIGRTLEAPKFSGQIKLSTPETQLGLSADWAQQKLRVTSSDLLLGGMPVSGLRADLAYMQGQIRVSGAVANLLGGKVELLPFVLTPSPLSADIVADVHNLDLAEVVKIANLNGLESTGRLSGQVPLTFAAGKLNIHLAELKAGAPGSLRYKPATLPSFMAPGGAGALLGQALENFSYTDFSALLQGQPGDNLTLKLRLAGSNPDFYNGHNVVFNFNLSGALESVLKDGLSNFRMSPEALGALVEKEGTRP